MIRISAKRVKHKGTNFLKIIKYSLFLPNSPHDNDENYIMNFLRLADHKLVFFPNSCSHVMTDDTSQEIPQTTEYTEHLDAFKLRSKGFKEESGIKLWFL
ncbi:hypothetical protein MSG28_005802 [Choristoneura fumiferana]|uniref:Uncharacterized protein n=1 Tax=Choristoneura fumiferana TaxID=7141 RepID=A0ACC0L0D7_CHOFU|nr:hypothetical protein MSG28_005802 [Choristoneura fumiferana]